ncbi:hypothetical protein FI667_g15077, partial [Globisporangium splendens]
MEQQDAAATGVNGLVFLGSRSCALEPPLSPTSAMLSALLEDESEDEEDLSDVFRLGSSSSATSSSESDYTVQCAVEENDAASVASLMSSTAATIATVPPNATLKRRRLKDELDTLREEFEGLQQDLRYLQTTRTFARDLKKPKRSDGDGLKKVRTSRLASLSKKSVLQENCDLHRLVNKQLKFTKAFGEKLDQGLEKAPPNCDLISGSDPVPALLTDADLKCYYEALTGKLDSLYTQLGYVFATCRATTDERRREAKQAVVVRNCDTNATTLQFRQHKMVPFEFQSVCDAIWQLIGDDAVMGSEGADGVVLPKDDNLILMKRTIIMESSDDRERREVKIPVRVVTKRFASKDRMVLCWEGTVTWPRSIVHAADDLQMCDKSWLVIKPMSSAGSTKMCFTQMCTHLSPSGGTVLALPEQVIKLTTTVIPRYQQIIDGYHQSVENSLLDKQVAARRLIL